MDTLEVSSLSCEQCDGAGFVCSVFEVPKDEILDDTTGREGTIIPSQAYLEREEEFDIVKVPYIEEEAHPSDTAVHSSAKTGILCRRWTDEAYAQRWGPIDYRRSMVPTASSPSGINGHNPTVAYCLVRHIYAIASWRRRRWDRHAMIRFWMKPIWWTERRQYESTWRRSQK